MASFNSNLVLNPGAEEIEPGPVPRWMTTGAFQENTYGGNATASPGGGSQLFQGGDGSAQSSAFQDISLADFQADINAGHVNAVLSGELGGYQSQGDFMTLSVSWRDANGNSLGTLDAPGVTAADRGNQSIVLPVSTNGMIPAGAVTARVTMTATRTDGNFNNGYADNISLVLQQTVCFRSGTRIATARGQVAVEDLQIGDLAVTSSGMHRPVRWLGHRAVDCGRHPRPEAVWPVRVSAGAFGTGLPERDLWLSPDHSVRVSVLDEVLIPIKHLINDATIAQVRADTVTYWHVELDSHDILLAEGLPTESFLDTGVRKFFANASTFTVLHPDFTPLSLDDFCRPLVQDGPVVDAVRTRLLARASAMGWSLTEDDDLHLLADGIVIRPERDGATACFTVPAGTREARLVTRSFVPERVRVGAGDGRRLGVPVRGVSVTDGGGIVRSLPIDHPLLSTGFSFVQTEERDQWRWTDGNARVPELLWAGATTHVALRIETAPDRGILQAWQAPAPESDVLGSTVPVCQAA